MFQTRTLTDGTTVILGDGHSNPSRQKRMFAHGSGRLCAMWRRRVAGVDVARTPKQVWAEWMAANDEDDPDRADLLVACLRPSSPSGSHPCSYRSSGCLGSGLQGRVYG